MVVPVERIIGGYEELEIGEIGFFICGCCCLSCLSSISISLLWRISERVVGTDPVKFVDLIIALFGSGKAVVRRALLAEELGARKEVK